MKGKKTAKTKMKDVKGKARKIDESDDEDEYPAADALREKESGIEDEAVEQFERGTVGLDQVRGHRSSHCPSD